MPIPTQYKQSGIAPIAIIIAVVLVAAAAGGYFVLNRSGGGGIPGIPGGVGLNPNCKYNDPDLCKFINSFKITNSYSAKSLTTDNTGKKFDSTFESVGSDKSHIVYAEAGKESFNVITIGDTTYTKDYSDNKWWKQKQPKQEKQLESQSNIKDEITKTEAPEDKTTYKKIGMEACGSRQCFKYQVIDPAVTDSTDYLWFDNSEYLLRRERNEAKDGSVTDTELNYSGININAPTPTKDAKPDQVILPAGGAMPGIKEQETPDLQKEIPVQKPEVSPEPKETPESIETPEPDTSGENQ